MDKITEIIPGLFGIIIIVAFWLIARKILKSLSDKINNAELYKEDSLRVLEEIRDELKELNRNNSK